MGNFTGLRVKVIVKEEYHELIQEITNYEDWETFTEQYPFLTEYVKQPRASFIPNGAVEGMPDSWDEEADSFRRKFDSSTGLWTFQCSLRNYGDEIEQFFREVLPVLISESIHIEYRYEYWLNSLFYTFVEDEIRLVGQVVE